MFRLKHVKYKGKCRIVYFSMLNNGTHLMSVATLLVNVTFSLFSSLDMTLCELHSTKLLSFYYKLILYLADILWSKYKAKYQLQLSVFHIFH